MKRLIATGALAVLSLAARPGGAIPGPENVLVVVNANSEDSRTVGREYVSLRRIPACNVLFLDEVPKGPVVSAADFRSRILTPIFSAIRSRGLAKQIDCVAYSTGFPYAVDVSADMAGTSFPRFITQPASLTGLTYLYDLALIADTSYLDMKANRYFRDRASSRRDRPWSERDRQLQSALSAAVARVAAAKSREEARQPIRDAAALAEELARSHPHNPELLYDFACLRALQGDADGAIRTLTQAVDAGWLNVTHTETDSDLASLRGRDDFRSLVRRMRTMPVLTEASTPFRSSVRWDAARSPTTSPEGRRYMLCAMLAYTGGPANTLDEAIASLRRSAGADCTRPKGTVYFMASADAARTGPRRWAFEPARAALQRLGVRSEVSDGVLPQNKDDVVGAAVGIATFEWSKSGSRILPGAFCDHLTSCAGIMTGGGQTLLSEWIRAGAAGSAGTVTEPYNLQAKFPTAFLHVYYASGCSLAEAFYQSVSGPYQQLLVGDPLCAPWARRVSVTVTGLKAGGVVRTRRVIRPKCAGASPAKRYELYVDGRLAASALPGKPLLLDPRSLSPGLHEARIVAVVGQLEWRGRTVVPFRVAD